MKKLSFVFLLLISMSSFSQIELVETNKSEIVSRISYAYIEKIGDNKYGFYYKNMNAPSHEYANFSFKNLNNDFDKLYQILMNGFQEVPRDPLKLKANGAIVWLKFYREEGVPYLQVQQYLGSEENEASMTTSKPLTAEDITNLFKK